MKVEITEYTVLEQYPYDKAYQVESFKTLEEAVSLCEKLRKDNFDPNYTIEIDYKVIG